MSFTTQENQHGTFKLSPESEHKDINTMQQKKTGCQETDWIETDGIRRTGSRQTWSRQNGSIQTASRQTANMRSRPALERYASRERDCLKNTSAMLHGSGHVEVTPR